MDSRDAVVIEPEGKADSSVILMHGLGADGFDFQTLVPELRLPPEPSIRWVFPHAPLRPVTINGGFRMRAWYDIVAIDPSVPEDESGIRESANAIGDLIQTEKKDGIKAQRIVIAGFSQGGAMALFTALRWPERLAGLAAMSCYLPLPDTLAAEAHPSSSTLPVFMAHGTLDPVVPLELGETARDRLRASGYGVSWHTYEMEHGLCMQEVADLREWLLGVLSRPAP